MLELFEAWDSVFVLTESHTVFLLREKDVAARLRILYEQNLYAVALALAHEWNLDEAEIAGIHLQWGRRRRCT